MLHSSSRHTHTCTELHLIRISYFSYCITISCIIYACNMTFLNTYMSISQVFQWHLPIGFLIYQECQMNSSFIYKTLADNFWHSGHLYISITIYLHSLAYELNICTMAHAQAVIWFPVYKTPPRTGFNHLPKQTGLYMYMHFWNNINSVLFK